METYFILFSILIFTAGILYTWLRWGVQESISITFYEHENKLLWYLWCVLYALPIMVVDHWLIAISFLGMGLVAIAPNYKESKLHGYIHNTGAYLAIIPIFLFLALQGIWPFVILMVCFTVLVGLIKLKNLTTWVEIAAYYLAGIGLLML